MSTGTINGSLNVVGGGYFLNGLPFGGGGGSGVISFNGRTGAVTLSGTDVDTALGYTPVNPTSLSAYALLSGATFSGAISVPSGSLLATPSALVLTHATGLLVGGIVASGTAGNTTYLRGDGSWSTVPIGITFQASGTTVASGATILNVIGAGATITSVSGVATLNVPGGGGTGPYSQPKIADFYVGNSPGSSVQSDTSTGLYMFVPSLGNNLMTLWDSVAAGGTFTITTGRNVSQIAGNSESGLVIGDASGKLVTWSYNPAAGGAPGAPIDYWNSYTSYSSTPAVASFNQVWQFYQVKYDGTSLFFYAGNDLNALVLFETLSATAFLATPTMVGIFSNGSSVAISAVYFHYKHGP